MNLNFLVNDYILIWNLLFQASISEEIHKLKQKLWINYKKEYNELYKDKEALLLDPKNFIPNDDTLYNIVMETDIYTKIKKETNKYRTRVLQLWDSNKKQIKKLLTDIIRVDVDDYNIFVVPSSLNTIDAYDTKTDKNNTIIFGKNIDKNNECQTIIDLIYFIVRKETKYEKQDSDILKSIVELAILNELPTIINKRSYYLSGDSRLDSMKRQIYPYWLMYLGVEKDELTKYMMRDKIAFDINRYTYERQLKRLDLSAFIDFCIRHKKTIIKEKIVEIL